MKKTNKHVPFVIPEGFNTMNNSAFMDTMRSGEVNIDVQSQPDRPKKKLDSRKLDQNSVTDLPEVEAVEDTEQKVEITETGGDNNIEIAKEEAKTSEREEIII